MASDYDKAIDQGKKNITINPNDSWARLFLATAYSEKAKHDEALLEMQKAKDLSEGKEQFPFYSAYVYLKSGKRDEARKY